MIDLIFKDKKADVEKLCAFGFIKSNKIYTYACDIVNGQFKLTVTVTADREVKTKVTDNDSDDEYILHLVQDAVGSYVGKVRTDYQNVLQTIADKCFDVDIFKSEYTHKIIKYVEGNYHDKLEFLWPKFSNNAIFRRKDSNKWYAAILVLSKKKLGLQTDEVVEIIDLRIEPEQIDKIVDNQKYFPGYHMNKKHWLTICLDGSVPVEEILERIDASYEMAKK